MPTLNNSHSASLNMVDKISRDLTRHFLIVILIPIVTQSFGQSWLWAEAYGSGGYNYINSIKTTSDGHILISGTIADTTVIGDDTLATNGWNTVGYLAKFTALGDPIWAKPLFILNGTVHSLAFNVHISVLPDHSIILSSHFKDSLVLGNTTLYETNGEMFVSRLDADGNFIWAKNFGDSNYPGSNIVQLAKNCVDSKGNIYVAGTFTDTAYFQTDTLFWQNGQTFIAKFDINGNEQWVKQCGTLGGKWQRAYDIAVDSSGNVYFTGAISTGTSHFGSTTLVTPVNRANTFIAKTDSSGHFQWAVSGGGFKDHPFGGIGLQIPPTTYGIGIETDGYDNVYLTGFFSDTVQFGNNIYYSSCGGSICPNFFLAAYDVDSSFKWFVQPFGGITTHSTGNDIDVDEEGNIYTSGVFRNKLSFKDLEVSSVNALNETDLFVAKFNPLGTCIGLINSDTKSSGGQLAVSCLNQAIFVGSYYSGSAGHLAPLGLTSAHDQDIFIAAIDNPSLCNQVSTLFEAEKEDFTFQAYPNPCSDYVIIDFSNLDLPGNSSKKIIIKNLLGEVIAQQNSTEDLVRLQINQLSGNFYFIQAYNEKGKEIGEAVKIIHLD